MASTRICSVDGCGKPYKAHGFCETHYYRFRTYGDPTVILRPPKSTRCGVLDCDYPVRQNGYCSAHYQRWYAYGDPLVTKTATHKERLGFILDHYLSETDECIRWPFACNEHGYGVISHNGRKMKAHQFMCELMHGPRPSSDHGALHTCGKGHEGCITPRHLYWGTQLDNMRDADRHGTTARGESLPQAILTDEAVRRIRAMKGVIPAIDLAIEYGVGRPTIYAVQNGRAWKHVR